MEQAAAVVVATTIEQLSSIFMTKTSTLMMERKRREKSFKIYLFLHNSQMKILSGKIIKQENEGRDEFAKGLT